MPTDIALSEPKPFPLRQILQHSILGVPLGIWAIALLLITIAAHFDAPVMAFEVQGLIAPF
jgi:hypothetical protein